MRSRNPKLFGMRGSSSSQLEHMAAKLYSVTGSPNSFSRVLPSPIRQCAAAFSGVMPLAAFLKTKRRFTLKNGARA